MTAQVLPFQSRFATVAGFRMHYVDEGSGPVLLCLHGNPTWCFYYRNVIRELKDSFRIIAPDFLGMGLSDRTPQTQFRAIDRINQLDEFVSILGLKRFSVLMHDWGGPLGTGFMLRRLDSIERIVYLNTTLTETESLPWFIRLAATPVVGKVLTRHSASFLRMMTNFGVSKRLSPDVAQAYLLPYRSRRRRDAIWDFVDDIPFDSNHPTYTQMMEIASGLPKIAEKPVKIIWGLKDLCFHREMLSKVAAHFPKGEILEIPDASHLVLDDAPQIVIPAIREFLERPLDQAGQMTPLADVTPATERDQGRTHVMYEAVMKIAHAMPNHPAVISPRWVRDPINGTSLHYSQITYGELSRTVSQYQRGLSDLGLAPGDRVLMLVTPGADFLALSLAVMGRGATPVFVDPGIGLERLFRCIQDANPHAFIGSPRAQILRLLRRSLFSRLKFYLTASEWAFSRGHSLGYLKRFANAPIAPVPLPIVRSNGGLRASNAALVAFTSGATGTPKGVIFTNEMLEEQLRIIRDELGQQAGTSDLTLLPIFSLYNVALGVASVFPAMPAGKPLALDLAEVAKIIADLGIQSSFGSPTLWTKIGEYAVRTNTTFDTVKRVFMAGAAVSASTLELVKRVVPHGEASTPYGATEALPVTYITASELSSVQRCAARTGEVGTLVGRPIDGIEVRIISPDAVDVKQISEAPALAVGLIGEVVVRGLNVSPEYLHRPDANKLGKLSDTDGFWHRMGDVGYFDERGYLYYCGRRSHSVYTPERTYHSVPIEELFNVHPKVRRSALVALRGAKDVGLAVEPKPEFWPETEADREQFIVELRELALRNPVTSDITQFFFHKSFPVDARHNAKIFRDQLSVWADKLLVTRKAA